MWKTYYQEIVKNKLKLGNVEEVDFTPEFRFNQRTLALPTKFANEYNKIVQDAEYRLYQLPTEPDGNQLVYWNMCKEYGSTGTFIKDDSGFGHNARVFGSGSKSAGPASGLDMINLNGASDFIRCSDSGYLNTAGGSIPATPGGPTTLSAMTALSFEFWIRPKAISLTANNRRRIFMCKSDQRSGIQTTRGYTCWVESDGTLWVSYRHNNNTVYSTSYGRIIARLDDLYFIVGTISGIGGATTIKIYVNGVVSTASTVTNKTPEFSAVESSGLDLFWGGTDEAGNTAKIQGSIGDMRIWRNKALTQTEVTNQWNNKYTIAAITDVARAGACYVAVEETPGTGGPGDPPGQPPGASIIYSFSAIGYALEEFTIDEANAAAPGGMGIVGGTNGVDALIPSQFLDAFNPTTHYSLTTLNQLSPNSKWKLSALPGTNGYVRTESYQHPGEQQPTNILRMMHGTAAPIITTNATKFAEFYARYVVRTLSQTASGEYNTLHFLFKYVDASNYAYVVLRPSNIEIRKVVSGVETLVGTGPTRANVFQVESIHTIEMWCYDDGQYIEVVADSDAAGSKLTIGSHSPGAIAVDSVLGSVSAMGIRANNSEIELDGVLVRPLLSDGFESGSPWSLTTVNSTSPNAKWKLEVAQGSGGFCRTNTTGGGTYNNILDIRHGTASPILLSQTTFTNLMMEWEGRVDSQLVVAQNNRLQIIFKWLNSTNYYYFVVHPSGWEVRRVLAGTDTIRVSSNANGTSDTSIGRYKILATNSGADFEVWKSTTLLYKEEFGKIRQSATGGSNVDPVNDDDNGLLAGAGKVGFRSVQSDCAVLWVSVFAS